MFRQPHHFEIQLSWSNIDQNPINDASTEARNQRARFDRDHTIVSQAIAEIRGSAAKQFHGNQDNWNPEQLFIAAIAQCHMLTFLFLAHKKGFNIVSYSDAASGEIVLDNDGIGGEFSQISLKPVVQISPSEQNNHDLIRELHEINAQAEMHCFIRRSVSAPVFAHLTVVV